MRALLVFFAVGFATNGDSPLTLALAGLFLLVALTPRRRVARAMRTQRGGRIAGGRSYST